MNISIHRPRVAEVHTLNVGRTYEAHVIDLRDNDSGGSRISVFVESDWASWDAIVEAVEEYRDRITRHPEMLAG